MASKENAQRIGKSIIGYPEDAVPTITTEDWLKKFHRDPKEAVITYLRNLFPIIRWIGHYNTTWLLGDVIAGFTVGLVIVPQGISYAILATLPAQYGLYSSFIGVLIYCFFATSKDVSIGPVAVMSITLSQIIKKITKAYPKKKWGGPQIGYTLSFICGFIVLGIGLLRLGWIVEFIPAPAVSGFMTGSAINIVASQVPGLMGITGFDTRAAPYKVIINTLKGLPRTQKDAAFGLFGLVTLYAIRITCDRLATRFPRRARVFFFISVLRNAFVLIVLTVAAWLYTRHRKSKSGKYPIKILGTVPRGFQHVGQPHIDKDLVKALGSQIPVATIVILLEHIAIGKSFGRRNNYKIVPSQELIAIGVTNTVGSCFGAYPATGSFSRTAIKSKSGVRTPAAGILTAIIVIVALYGLTPAFYYIPTAGLSAIIIHAVADLVASPAQVYSFWRVAPLEFFIWLAAVLVTVFSTIEDGIYTSIAASGALLLVRIAFPRGHFLGRVTLHSDSSNSSETREVFVPLTPDGVTNPQAKIIPPAPGVIIYRTEDGFTYPNCSRVHSAIVDYVTENMRRGEDMTYIKAGDRPWNDPKPRLGGPELEQQHNERKPILHAIVYDFSAVSQLDTTAVQSLIDTRGQVEKWTGGQVEFHFASILSPWIRRALVAGGFGTGAANHVHEVAPVVALRGGDDYTPPIPAHEDLESPPVKLKESSSGSIHDGGQRQPLAPADTPFFHIDLAAAVRAAGGYPTSEKK